MMLTDCSGCYAYSEVSVLSLPPKMRRWYKASRMDFHLRQVTKKIAVALIGTEIRPRRIVRGLARGYRIYASPAENLSYLLGTAEPHLQKIIRQYVFVGDTVYDIGANLGYVSLSLARQVGPHGRVIAFEPVPRNLGFLRQTVAVNGLRTVTIFDSAASDHHGQAIIRMTANLSTPSLVWHRNDPSSSELTINTVAIDDLVQSGEIAPPKFVKIDVEGAEGLVLRGMRNTIASSKPVLVVECSDIGRETTWNLLRDLGYVCQLAVTRASIPAFGQYRHQDFLWLPPGS